MRSYLPRVLDTLLPVAAEVDGNSPRNAVITIFVADVRPGFPPTPPATAASPRNPPCVSLVLEEIAARWGVIFSEVVTNQPMRCPLPEGPDAASRTGALKYVATGSADGDAAGHRTAFFPGRRTACTVAYRCCRYCARHCCRYRAAGRFIARTAAAEREDTRQPSILTEHTKNQEIGVSLSHLPAMVTKSDRPNWDGYILCFAGAISMTH
jgi:hypothetical protein